MNVPVSSQEFRALEKVGNDDFQLILAGGAEAYATHELHHLLRRLRLINIRQKKHRRQLFTLGATIPFTLAMATIFTAINQIILVYATLSVMLAAICTLIYGSKQTSRSTPVIPHDALLKSIIQREL